MVRKPDKFYFEAKCPKDYEAISSVTTEEAVNIAFRDFGTCSIPYLMRKCCVSHAKAKEYMEKYTYIS